MRVSVRGRDERGAVAVLAGLLAVLLLSISAFTVDFGMAYATKRQLSSASDAASLAADAVYKTEYKGLCTVPGNDPSNPLAVNASVRADAEAAADSLFVQDFPKGAATDGNISSLSCNGTGVQVTYTSSGKSYSPFGPLLGGSGTITTAGSAAASYSVGNGICALCVLGNVNTSNTNFSVDGGDIYINGNVDVTSQSYWTANTSITIAGTVNGLSQSQAAPDWTTGPTVTDPFAGVTLPTAPWGLTSRPGGNPCVLGPGVYTTYDIGNITCVLQPGAYVFTGALTFQSTNSLLTSNGQPVSLFFASPSGGLDVKNGHIYKMPAPGLPLPTGFPSNWPAGFSIMYARDNTNTMSLQGNGDLPGLSGSIYALKSVVTFNGNSCFQTDGGALVIGGVNSVGNSCLKVTNATNTGKALPGNLRLTK